MLERKYNHRICFYTDVSAYKRGLYNQWNKLVYRQIDIKIKSDGLILKSKHWVLNMNLYFSLHRNKNVNIKPYNSFIPFLWCFGYLGYCCVLSINLCSCSCYVSNMDAWLNAMLIKNIARIYKNRSLAIHCTKIFGQQMLVIDIKMTKMTL